MNTRTRPAAEDLLWQLRSLQSPAAGDLALSEHCTGQQGQIVRLAHPGAHITTLDALTEVVGIPIEAVPDIPVDGTAFHTPGGWRIHVLGSLSPTDQVRVALHELKHIIDNPFRQRADAGGFSPEDFEHLADHFADCALRETTP